MRVRLGFLALNMRLLSRDDVDSIFEPSDGAIGGGFSSRSIGPKGFNTSWQRTFILEHVIDLSRREIVEEL
jgi:hypothetical protein